MSQPSLIRPDSIYVSYVVRKALTYARAEHQSIDELAEWILMEWLSDNHPKVLEHIHAQDKADKEFRKQYEQAPK